MMLRMPSSVVSLPFHSSAACMAAALLAAAALAQAPDVPIRAQTQKALQAEEDAIGKQVAALVAGERLATTATAEGWCRTPTARTLQLPPPNQQELAPAALAMQARRSQLRVGWCFLCTHCDHWHTAMGLGYALTADGAVATCAHALLRPPMEVRDARLIAVTNDGTVHPVTAVLANDEGMDAAIVAIDLPTGTAPLVPLPLATDVRPGDLAWCWSRPLEQRDFFGTGMVNRFYLDRDVAEEHGRDSLPFLAAVRMDVDMPWAPGSSGAALLDRRGNAIGHVSEIRPLSNGMPAPGMPGALTAAEVAERGNEPDPELDKPATLGDLEARQPMITLHTAVPARGLQFLATTKPAPTSETTSETTRPAGK
jgi:hypothetical protein